MARLANDGRGRLGGRTKGTPNKPLVPVQEWAEQLINKNRSQFERDLKECTPYERACVLSSMIAASRKQ